MRGWGHLGPLPGFGIFVGVDGCLSKLRKKHERITMKLDSSEDTVNE